MDLCRQLDDGAGAQLSSIWNAKHKARDIVVLNDQMCAFILCWSLS